MKIYVPSVGTELMVLKPWTFDLYHEYRNRTLIEHFGLESVFDYRHPEDVESVMVTIPVGTVLRVSRVYIRQGSPDYDSLTFRSSNLGKKAVRFWAKLEDVNTLDISEVR